MRVSRDCNCGELPRLLATLLSKGLEGATDAVGGIRARRIATLLPSSNSGLSTCLLSSLCCARMASARKAPHILTATNHVTLGHVQALFEEVLSATPKDPGKRAAATRVLRVEAAEWDDH